MIEKRPSTWPGSMVARTFRPGSIIHGANTGDERRGVADFLVDVATFSKWWLYLDRLNVKQWIAAKTAFGSSL